MSLIWMCLEADPELWGFWCFEGVSLESHAEERPELDQNSLETCPNAANVCVCVCVFSAWRSVKRSAAAWP